MEITTTSRTRVSRVLSDFRDGREKQLMREATLVLDNVKMFFFKNPYESEVSFMVNDKSDEFYQIISDMAIQQRWQFVVSRTWFGLCKGKLRFIKDEIMASGNDYYLSQYREGLY